MNDQPQEGQTLSFFDRHLGNLHGAPDVIHTKATTVPVVGVFGFGTHTYIVQTYRQREEGDTIFLQDVSDGRATRIVIPARIADIIARQREQLTGQSRSRAATKLAEDRKAAGIVPGFMKKKKGEARP